MRYYKLTDQDMQTHMGFQWELGTWCSIDEVFRVSGAELCSRSWFHCTASKELAIFLNPIQAVIQEPRLFMVEALGMRKENHGMKLGFTHMKLVKELDIPSVTMTQRIAFGLLCAMEVYKEKKWQQWAKNWLTGIDRSRATAREASAYYQSSWTAASSAVGLMAADSAASVTQAVCVGSSCVNVVQKAAYAVLDASYADLDLIGLARKAMLVE